MSTDRELLELAAKAAGIDGFFVDAGLNAGSNALPKVWNPLTDDGDEARLEGMLCFDVMWGMASVTVDSCTERYNDHGGDKQKARRFAGVRAAAEIGRATP